MAFDQAREFLARLPFPADDEPGYINLHWRDKGKIYWSGRACRNVDELIGHLAYWTNKGPRDYYVCMSRQTEAEERVSKAGYPYRSAVRKTENATRFSGLWMDLDFKNYKDENEAAAAFGAFIKTTQLPAPTIYVHSGGGLHIHWILQSLTGIGDWQGLAHALAEACKRCALRADTACTVDAVRILRLPDTLNYKYDPPRPVKLLHVGTTYTLAELATPLEPYKVTPKSNVVNSLAAGIKHSPVDVSALINECGYIQDALVTHGSNHAQPLWHITGLLSTFLKDGRSNFHEMSKGHSAYVPDDTDKMYDRKETEQASKNLGWPMCHTIHTAGSKFCSHCPNLIRGKSPLNFAHVPPPVTLVSNKLPTGYRHTSKFHVEQSKVDADGKQTWEEIASWPMYDGWFETDKPSKLHFTSSLQNKPVLIELLSKNIDRTEMRGEIQNMGFELFTPQVKPLGIFLVAWIKELKAQNQYTGNTRALGWNDDNTNFAYGGNVWGASGATSTAACPDPYYVPVGDVQPWKDAAKLVTDQQRPELDAILAASFGAPLTTFTGHACWMFSVYSVESGAGKTTAMKAAQAVWGNPSKAMQSLGDTQNAVTHKLGRTANLPIFWDEMKMGNTASIKNVSFFLGLSGGREKDRLNSNAEAKEVHTWKTILVGASNQSMVSFVNSQSKVTDAELMRIVELNVPARDHGEVSPTDASQTIGALDANYGRAGEIYAEWIGANVSKIKHDVVIRSKELEADVNISPSERFWQANYVCQTLGAEYANALGLTDINVQALKDCLQAGILSMRNSVEEGVKHFEYSSADVSDLLWEFIMGTPIKNRLVTDIIWSIPGRVPAGKVNVLGSPTELFSKDAPHMQIGVSSGHIRVSYQALSDWLAYGQKSNYKENYPAVLVALLQNKTIRDLKGTIGAGAPHGSPTIRVLDFFAAQIPELEQLVSNLTPTSMSASSTNVVLFPSKP